MVSSLEHSVRRSAFFSEEAPTRRLADTSQRGCGGGLAAALRRAFIGCLRFQTGRHSLPRGCRRHGAAL